MTSQSKYYDEFATNCEGCGWLRQGNFLDGMPYLSCAWNGTIMHTQSDAECKAFKTPEQVSRYMADQQEKAKKRTKCKK